MATTTFKSKKSQKIKFKKAPGAPRRFKSAYMFFSESMHKVLRLHVLQNKKIRAAEVAKMVSQSWKNLSDEERAPWIEMGRQDRERYEKEKASYTGPWKVPTTASCTAVEGAPKKPMSAFLAFSNQRRKALATANPHLTGTQISTLLSQMWKECPEELKKSYRDTEARERAVYKRNRAAWEAQMQADLLAAAASNDNDNNNSATGYSMLAQTVQQQQEELPQAPQCISSLYTALEKELLSFKPSQQIVKRGTTTTTTNTTPTMAQPLALEKMPPVMTKSSFPTAATNTLFSFGSNNSTATQAQPTMHKPRMVSQERIFIPSDNLPYQPTPIIKATNKTDIFCGTDEINYSLDDLLECEELLEDFAPTSPTSLNNNNNNMDAFSAQLAMVTEPPTLPNFGSCSSFFA